MLRERFGHAAFRPGQEAVVEAALAGENLLVVMPTGSGKSLLFQLPALLEEGLTLVVSPLIALMKDQVDDLTERGIAATFINSSLSAQEQRQRIESCQAGHVRLLYVAPERFRSAAFVNMFRHIRVARLAIDEAHCISQWGHDFRPDYRRLRQARQLMGEPKVTALTATATPRVQKDIIDSLGLPLEQVQVHVHGFDRPNLSLAVQRTGGDGDKVAIIEQFIRENRGCGIIYAGTRKAAERLVEQLAAVEPSVVLYHAGLDSERRASAQEAFMGSKARLAVATVAFGMGVDKSDIRFVLHYHLPGSLEQYYQEIGRAGRDGQPSQCLLLYNAGDRSLREFFIDLNYPQREQVEAVMHALYELKGNPILKTHAEIAELAGEEVREGQVGTCLRLLDEAGIARGLTGEASATVHLEKPGVVVLKDIRGKVQRAVFEAMAEAVDLETAGSYSINLEHLARAAALSTVQVQRAMAALDEAGHLRYDPPFRGRGVEKLMDQAPPFDQAKIDWARQDLLRSAEEEKLAAMEEYIHSRSCRRDIILRYFGEQGRQNCSTCDNCQADSGGRGQSGADGILAQQPAIAPAVLVCLKNLRFPLGVQKTAQVVTGSRDTQLRQWKLDRNPAYGKAAGTQDQVKSVISQLINEGYLCQEGPFDRPVLALTERGSQAAESINPAALGAAAAPSRAAQAIVSARPSDPQRVVIGALRCVEQLSPAGGIGRIAEVLTGSKAQWVADARANRLDVYGLTTLGQKEVRQIIQNVIAQGLLRQDLSDRYPVLQLTPAGRAKLETLRASTDSRPAKAAAAKNFAQEDAADEADAAEAAGVAGAAGPALAPDAASAAGTRKSPRAQAAFASSSDEYPESPRTPDPAAQGEQSLSALLETAIAGDRDSARAAVLGLRLFHPEQIAGRLQTLFADGAPKRRSRAIWLAGELASAAAVDLLLAAARAPDSELRRLSAFALAKAAAGFTRQSQAAHRLGPVLQQALDQLLADPDGEVRRHAEAAVERLMGPPAE